MYFIVSLFSTKGFFLHMKYMMKFVVCYCLLLGCPAIFFPFEKTLADLLFGILGIVVVRFECSCTSDRHTTMPAIFVSYTYDIYLSMIYFC